MNFKEKNMTQDQKQADRMRLDSDHDSLSHRLGEFLDEAGLQVTFTGWKVELEQLESQVRSLFDAIKHGDEQHQVWLRDAIRAHFPKVNFDKDTNG